MCRSVSHASSSGMSVRAWSTPGLLMMPIRSMGCMQQKLLVPLGSQDWTVHDLGSEPQFLGGAAHFVTGRLMQRRIPHNAALPYILAANFELRFDEYNHFAVFAQESGDRWKQHRRRYEAH